MGTSDAKRPTRPRRTGKPASDGPLTRRPLFGTREAAALERIAHGHAVLGSYTSPAGGTVVTSGSTDWAHGLAGRDPQIERITANVLDRLG